MGWSSACASLGSCTTALPAVASTFTPTAAASPTVSFSRSCSVRAATTPTVRSMRRRVWLRRFRKRRWSRATASTANAKRHERMIIKNQDDVTAAVLSEIERASDARFREIVSSAVKHLHAFVRETRLTEAEFQKACATIATLGQLSNESHNEVVLVAGSLGVSSLVCLLNNGDKGKRETTANLLGPFWRAGSPRTANGASIVRSPTEGDPIFATAWIKDRDGYPVAGVEVDVWHTSGE